LRELTIRVPRYLGCEPRIGSDLRLIGYEVEHADRLYHVYSRQAFIWPYDGQARLAGEHLYEDKTSLRIEEVPRSEAITPARVREIHREQLLRTSPPELRLRITPSNYR
jgi:hypothetical protein